MFKNLGFALAAAACGMAAAAQESPVPALPSAGPHGQVLFSSPATDEQTSSDAQPPVPAGPPDHFPKVPVTDQERSAIRITGYDLDVHLVPAEARESVSAKLTIRNVSSSPVNRIPVQLSSTLRFESVSLAGANGAQAVTFTQSPVATDADHTGYAEEAVVTPANPLQAGGTVTLNVFYTGAIRQSSARLDLLGVSPEKAAETDWDSIAPVSDTSATALRGFGNVLWYPVAAPLALLGDGNRLFAIAGEQKLANTDASMRMRLTVEYAGEPPEGAIFDGELKMLDKVPDDQDQPVVAGQGVATVEFGGQKVGFRLPSLFLTAQKPVLTDGELLAAMTARPESLGPYRDGATRVATLLSDWFGVTPERPLVLLDHPGQPFEDHAFLVGQLAADAEVDVVSRLLVAPLTHAWMRSAQPWISDGLAEFMRLQWTEREAGRQAALSQMVAEDSTLALADGGAADGGGQPLLHCSSEIFYRVKAAAVWWQLRDILGEQVLQQGLQSYRHAAQVETGFDADPKSMQRTLEKVSGKDLEWFFSGWVDRDAGLPDLSIVQVNARALPSRPGRDAGYLVVVEVRNAGGASAEVPVTVRSGNLTATERVRVTAGAVAAVRIVFQGTPEEVQVNDGSTPEVGRPEHLFTVKTLE